MFAGGADHVFAAAAAGNYGIFEAAAERDAYAFGLDVDQCPAAPGHLVELGCAIVRHEGDDAVQAIKTIGASGQIALGKQYAGQHVLVDEIETGVWMIKLGEFIPANERWLHEPKVVESLDRGLRWAAENPPADTDLDDLERRLAK